MATSEIRERPIMFGGAMVRAILAGTKTQTRRVVKEAFSHGEIAHSVCRDGAGDWIAWFGPARANDMDIFTLKAYPNGGGFKCPYGKPGALLWCKETWQPHPEAGVHYPEVSIPADAVCYAADGTPEDFAEMRPWRPSIYMPRWASRILLRVEATRVQRVQEISPEDCLAEGIAPQSRQAVLDYAALWDSINSARGFPWESNPWVWAITFSVQEVTR